GALACVRNVNPSPEVCNGLDDDCVSGVDNGDPGGGASCSTGQLGVCDPGTQHCVSGAVGCVRNVNPSAEICGNSIDENCNGPADDPCAACNPNSAWRVDG